MPKVSDEQISKAAQALADYDDAGPISEMTENEVGHYFSRVYRVLSAIDAEF